MKAIVIAITLCVSAVVYAADANPPVAATAQQLAQYKSAVQKTLADLKVTVRELTLRDGSLLVSYEDCNEQKSHAFITGAVLTLAAPLASGSDTICLRQYSGKRKLSEISVAPEDARTVYAAELRDGEEARLARLKASVLAAAGLGEAPSVTLVSQSKGGASGPAHGVASNTASQKQAAEKLLAALGAAKLENIQVAVDECGGWCVDFENRTYRSDVDAIAAALRVIAENLPPVQLTVTALRDEVPVSQISLYLGDYAAAQGELLSGEELARRWSVKPGECSQPRRTLAAGNSSRGKVDIALRPDVHYEIGNEADPFESDLFLVANADSTLGRGWHANVQSSTRLTSGLDTVIDRTLLTKTGWLGRDWLATGSVGKFEEGFYGWYGEVQWDHRQHRLGLTANSVSDSLEFGSSSRRHALGYYEYEVGKLGLTARLGYGRFVDSNTDGALLSLQRRFGESVVAAEAVRAEGGAEALNFRLSVPLGPRVADAPSALRLRSDTAFTTEYMSNLSLQGDYLQKGQDLRSFRGELSAPYLQSQVSRVLGERQDDPEDGWPSSQSHEGTSGLMRIPTADVIPDGTLLAGVSYMDAEHSRVVTDHTDAVPVFVGVGLLPNLELVGKVTIFNDVTAFDWNVNTDRSFNAHYRIVRQKRHFPALAVGAQDVTFGTTSSYLGKAQYAVATWAEDRYRVHLGFGRERLKGPFGGLQYALRSDRRLQAMVDYDTEYFNVGLRGFLSKWVTLDVSLLGLSDLGGAVVFKTELQ